ncbi:hypothetical protein DACRYDRAFT_117879 [Dacryopinax primogenitus]|uniref:Uncharacterized protein n=1 Tax=Dacryopinax primogenitus (strain DJM 731) TaxID=1858805 RepID=M5G1J1_DACPD|nr:uncharacterized protein DACRYDRAFT_117879 [Dacryopinax primogenitus]EJT99691.1 hypothetical protein DACRYDRAFT_117879 [Dacryopinax primogenitus]
MEAYREDDIYLSELSPPPSPTTERPCSTCPVNADAKVYVANESDVKNGKSNFRLICCGCISIELEENTERSRITITNLDDSTDKPVLDTFMTHNTWISQPGQVGMWLAPRDNGRLAYLAYLFVFNKDDAARNFVAAANHLLQHDKTVKKNQLKEEQAALDLSASEHRIYLINSVPLALACGVGLILSIVGIPLTNGNSAYQAVEAFELIIFVFSALWWILATISHRDFFLHQTRVWAWFMGIGFILQAAIFSGWMAAVHASLDCPPLPQCETTLGGICPQDQLDIYNDILICQVNWGLLGANIAVFTLEFCAILTVLIMRVVPAIQSPERGIWYASVYSYAEINWRFVPCPNTERKLTRLGLIKFIPFIHPSFRQPQPPTVRITTLREPDSPATMTTFSHDKGDWLKMKGLSGPASAPTETTDNASSRRSSLV